MNRANILLNRLTSRPSALMIASSLGLLLPLTSLHANEFLEVWRRPHKTVGTQPTPPTASAPAHLNVIANSEAKLATMAMQDEQLRLASQSGARGEAMLAQTAASDEKLMMAYEVPAAGSSTAAPSVAAPLKLNVPGTSSLADSKSVTISQAKREGMLAEMLEDKGSDDTSPGSMSSARLKQVFREAIMTAAERTPKMQQIYTEHLAAEADVDQAKGQRWPQLTITGQTRQKDLGSERNTQYNPGNSVGVNLTTTLFDWGQTRKTIDSRKALADAKQQQYDAQFEELAYQVINTSLELAREQRAVELYENYVERMQKLCDMLADIVHADRGRTSELTQAQARLMQAKIGRDAAATKVRDAQLALSKWIGNTSLRIPNSSQWPIQPASRTELLTKAQQHPAVLQAAAQARAADLTAESTRASSKPKLSWVVSGNTGRDEVGLRQPWATMLTVSWPLFSGGSQRAASTSARYRADAQWQNVAQQRLDLEYQLRIADEDARSAFMRANEYHDLSIENDKIRKGFFEQWYQLGQRSLLDVLSTESDYYTNRINESSSRFDGYQAVIREYAAAGQLAQWLGSDH